jgi:two-component system cell cycle sensor histidine kinase/response regulator CckA
MTAGLPNSHLETALADALRRERELADTFDNGAMAIHWVGPDGTILRANQAELTLVGYAAEEYLGRNIAEFHADAPVIEDLLRRLHAGEVVHDYPARLRCKDGTIKHVLIDSSVYREGDAFLHTRCFTRDVTVNVRTQEELRRSHERLHLAAEVAQDLIWDWDYPRRDVVWSGATRKYFELSSPEAELHTLPDDPIWASRLHPEDLPTAQLARRTALEQGSTSWEQEYRFRRPDGSYALMLERAAILRDEDGSIARVVAVMSDITRRRVAEEATLRLAAIVASASDAIVGKTLDGRITSWNAAAERIFGYTEREMLGQSVFILVPPELHATEDAMLAKVRQGDRVEFSVTQRIRKDGTRIAVSLTVSPIWDPSGVVIGVSSIQRDVTERERAAEELVRREERYRALVTASSQIVWTADTQGRFDERQPAWEAYTGQTEEESAGFGWLEAFHPDDRESLKRAWFEAIDRHTFEERAARVWHHEHHRYRHSVTRAAPVHRSDGSVREWIGTLTDVEEQHTAAERLRQAERLESVGRLAGGVAHEANNQMTVVLGAADFLLRHHRDDRTREDLQHIRQAAQRTAAITQQLLAFSRRQFLQPQLVDLNAIVRKLQSVLQRALGETSQVVLRLSSELGSVRADPGQLDQVLLNLALNARDAMPDGGVLTLETGRVVLNTGYVAAKGLQTMQPGSYVRLMASDTGRGMDQETLQRVFEPFFTTKPMGQGTGLGLSTVYGIIKQSGGFIWVYSEPGQGTTFKIYLPEVQHLSSAERPPTAAVTGGSEVILLAEDDELVRSVLARSLREYGYDVLEARDGIDALEVVSRRPSPPNLVIMDAVMPRLNGRELSRELRKRWPGVSTLFISGYTDLDSHARGLLEEGCDFLQKPIETEVLASKVHSILHERHPRR